MNNCLKMLVFSGLLVLFFAASAAAEIRPGTMTLTPQIGVMVFEGNQNLSTGFTGGLGLGYSFDEHWGTEGVLTVTGAREKKGYGSSDIKAGHLDLLYHFQPQQRLVPYLSAVLGGMKLEEDHDTLLGYGIGVKYFYAEDLALRFDLKHLLDFNYHDVHKSQEYYNILVATGGLAYQFDVTKSAPVDIDADYDGVIDTYDRCPNTPFAAKVDAAGCPPVVIPEAAPQKALDSDKDGVTDTLDLCPNSAAGVAVDQYGCALPPPAPFPVAEVPEPSLILYLEYPTNESDVRPELIWDMRRITDFIKENPGHTFVIEGHTDSIGNDADNLKLSQLRAEKIRLYLIEQMAVPEELLEANGFGESRPIADNATQEGRQKNRRVVITAQHK